MRIVCVCCGGHITPYLAAVRHVCPILGLFFFYLPKMLQHVISPEHCKEQTGHVAELLRLSVLAVSEVTAGKG